MCSCWVPFWNSVALNTIFWLSTPNENTKHWTLYRILEQSEQVLSCYLWLYQNCKWFWKCLRSKWRSGSIPPAHSARLPPVSEWVKLFAYSPFPQPQNVLESSAAKHISNSCQVHLQSISPESSCHPALLIASNTELGWHFARTTKWSPNFYSFQIYP